MSRTLFSSAAQSLTSYHTGNSEVVATLIFNLQTNGEQNAAAAVALYMIFVLVLLALFARRITGMQEIRGADIARRRSIHDRITAIGSAAAAVVNPTRKQKHGYGE